MGKGPSAALKRTSGLRFNVPPNGAEGAWRAFNPGGRGDSCLEHSRIGRLFVPMRQRRSGAALHDQNRDRAGLPGVDLSGGRGARGSGARTKRARRNHHHHCAIDHDAGVLLAAALSAQTHSAARPHRGAGRVRHAEHAARTPSAHDFPQFNRLGLDYASRHSSGSSAQQLGALLSAPALQSRNQRI